MRRPMVATVWVYADESGTGNRTFRGGSMLTATTAQSLERLTGSRTARWKVVDNEETTALRRYDVPEFRGQDARFLLT